MSEQRPTRRDLMKPAQLLGLALIAGLFAGVVTLVSMGFFQNRFPGEAGHALVVGAIVAGITFIATIIVISLLLLAVQPDQITHAVDKPVLIARDDAVEHDAQAGDAAGRASAGGADAAGQVRAGEADAAAQVGAGEADAAAGHGARGARAGAGGARASGAGADAADAGRPAAGGADAADEERDGGATQPGA